MFIIFQNVDSFHSLCCEGLGFELHRFWYLLFVNSEKIHCCKRLTTSVAGKRSQFWEWQLSYPSKINERFQYSA